MNLTNRAWYVDFQLGLVSYDDKATNLFVAACARLTNATRPTNSFTPQFRVDPRPRVVSDGPTTSASLIRCIRATKCRFTTFMWTRSTWRRRCSPARSMLQFLNSALAQGLIEVRSNYVYGVGGTNIYCDTYVRTPTAAYQWSGSAFSVRDGRDLHPVNRIRWFGAIAYCNWASARDGFRRPATTS